jgi:hypothetical protein
MGPASWLRVNADRATAWLLVGLGALALLLGWAGVSGTGLPGAQLPYIISGGVGGIFLLGLGAVLWLSADLRDEWIKLDRLERRVDDVATRLEHQSSIDASPAVVALPKAKARSRS